MWFSVHGTTGAAITLATGDYILGGSVAFVSHFVWDYVGESGLKDRFHAVIIEATCFAMFLVGFLMAPYMFWETIFGPSKSLAKGILEACLKDRKNNS